MKIPKPKKLDSSEIHQLRIKLCLTKKEFADVLNVQEATVVSWELSNDNKPVGAAKRLLDITKFCPDTFVRTCKKSKILPKKFKQNPAAIEVYELQDRLDFLVAEREERPSQLENINAIIKATKERMSHLKKMLL